MRTLGKLGVTLALSLILSVTLFTSGAFASSRSFHQSSTAFSTLAWRGIAFQAQADRQNHSIQWRGNPQPSGQQVNYQQNNDDGEQCNATTSCQQAARCVRIFKSVWGWIYICNGW